MKVLMVLTSHDQLGNTGRKTRLLAGGTGGALLCLQRCRCPDHPRIAQGRAPAARSQVQRAELPDRHHPSVREGCRRPSPAFRLRILSNPQSSLTQAGTGSPAAALTISSRRRSWPGQRSPARLNFGDCFAYALACATGEPLLVQGRRFRTHRRRASATRNSITHHHSWTGQWKGQQATDLASSARKGRGRFLCLLILVFDGAAIGAGRGDGDRLAGGDRLESGGDAPYRVDDHHVLFGYVFSASPRAAMREPHQKRLYRSIRCRGGAAGRGELYAWLVPERVRAWR